MMSWLLHPVGVRRNITSLSEQHPVYAFSLSEPGLLYNAGVVSAISHLASLPFILPC